jgi:hypothetical protein
MAAELGLAGPRAGLPLSSEKARVAYSFTFSAGLKLAPPETYQGSSDGEFHRQWR